MSPQDVVILGRLFNEGIYNTSQVVALSGSEFTSNCYISTPKGAQIEHLISNNLKSEDARLISGNILTGEKVNKENVSRIL